MKTFLHTLAALCLCAPALLSNEIIVFTTKDAYTGQFYGEQDPADDAFGNNVGGATAPTGNPVSNYSFSEPGYLIVDLTAGKAVSVGYSTIPASPGVPASKVMSFSTSSVDLEDYFGDSQRLKTANSFLWHYQDGSFDEAESEDPNDPLLTIPGRDQDQDGNIDYFGSFFRTEFLTGVGTPFVASSTVTLSNVPRKITGLANATYVEDYDAQSFDDGDYPPFRSFTKEQTAITVTLETPLTKAANTTPIASTTSLFGNTDSRAAGTLMNAMQRVHNALFAKGHRLGEPLDPINFEPGS